MDKYKKQIFFIFIFVYNKLNFEYFKMNDKLAVLLAVVIVLVMCCSACMAGAGVARMRAEKFSEKASNGYMGSWAGIVSGGTLSDRN